jgi:hypothetical protein
MEIDEKSQYDPAPLSNASPRPLLVHHVARKTGYSERMVRHLAQIGRLRGRKLGKKIWGFDRTDVEQFGGVRE